VLYEEEELEASITLYWSSETMEKQVMKGFLSGEWVCNSTTTSQPKGLNATYTCKQPSICYTQGIDALYAIALDYPEYVLVLNISKPVDGMKVTLLGCNKTLPWEYKDGQLIINTSQLKHSDLKSTAAWVFKISPSVP
jgi:hypothetical protein